MGAKAELLPRGAEGVPAALEPSNPLTPQGERAELSYSEGTQLCPQQAENSCSRTELQSHSCEPQCHPHSCEPQSFPLKGRKQRRFPVRAGVVGVGSVTDSVIKWEIFNCGALGGPTFVRALPLTPLLLFDQPWVHAHVSPVASEAAT